MPKVQERSSVQCKMNAKKINWDLEKDEKLIEAIQPKQCLYDMGSALYSDINAKKKAWMEIGNSLHVDASACKERWESLRSQFRKHLNKKKCKSGQAAKKLFKWRLEEQILFLTPFVCNDRQRSTSVRNEENSEDEDGEDDEDSENGEDGEDGEEGERIDSDSNSTTNVNNAYDIRAVQTNKARKEPSNNTNKRVVKITKLKKKTSVNNDSRETASSTLMKYLIQQNEQPKEQQKEHNYLHSIDTFFSLMASTVKNFNPADQHAIKTKVFLLVNEMEGKYISEIHNYHIPQQPLLTTPMPSPSLASSVYSSASSSLYINQNEYGRLPQTRSNHSQSAYPPTAGSSFIPNRENNNYITLQPIVRDVQNAPTPITDPMFDYNNYQLNNK